LGGDSQQPQRDQRNVALSSWFPRPACTDDLEILEGSWTRTALRDLLVDPAGQEWRHKVGVVGRADGSAKPTTRLLATRGWVCKTRVDQRYNSATDARAALEAVRAAGLHAGIWHPGKTWAVMRVDDAWYPLTVCPELLTLRRLLTFAARSTAWIEMIQDALDVQRMHHIGLDLNPANFAREGAGSPLFYLDDELYPTLDERAVASAMVARVPEEPDVLPPAWKLWGLALRVSLATGRLAWDRILDEIRMYPLAERYEPRRAALLDGLVERAATKAPRATNEQITCVFADVHANLAALEAVLEDARERGADEFLFLGDAVGYGPDPAACVRRIAELRNATLVRGNHDHAIATGRLDVGMNSLARQCAEWTRTTLGVAELDWLRALPTEHVGDGWIAVHGAPKDPHRFLAYVYELTYEDNLRHLRGQGIPICFYGHTHVQLLHVEQASGPTKLAGVRAVELNPLHYWLVNPGSIGQPRDGDPRAAYALWNRRTQQLATLRVAYDIERTASALAATPLPSQLAVRLRGGV